jgi:hypothetical protein
MNALGHKFLLRRIRAGDENARATLRASHLLLHGGERNLNARAAGRFVDADDAKRAVVELQRITETSFALLDPDRIDNRHIAARRKRLAFNHPQPGEL